QEILAERGVDLDVDGFDEAMADQRSRAKASAKGSGVVVDDEVGAFRAVSETSGPTTFVGRDVDSTTTTVVGVVPGEPLEDGRPTVSVFLAHTPSSAESGGQSGDTGAITAPGAPAEVADTVYGVPGLHRHIAVMTEGIFVLGDEVTATIDS